MNARHPRHPARRLALGALLALFGSSTFAATSPAETCDQIRAQIAAQIEVLPRPNLELLGKVGANEHCDFTSAETWRAAWGAKPLNGPEPGSQPSGKEHDDRGEGQD